MLGDNQLAAILDPGEVAAQVVLQLSNPDGIYGHIHYAIIATSPAKRA